MRLVVFKDMKQNSEKPEAQPVLRQVIINPVNYMGFDIA